MDSLSTVSWPTRLFVSSPLHLLLTWPQVPLSTMEMQTSSSSWHWSQWYKLVPSVGMLTRKPTCIYNTSWRFVVCSPSRESLKKPSDSASSCSRFLRRRGNGSTPTMKPWTHGRSVPTRSLSSSSRWAKDHLPTTLEKSYGLLDRIAAHLRGHLTTLMLVWPHLGHHRLPTHYKSSLMHIFTINRGVGAICKSSLC